LVQLGDSFLVVYIFPDDCEGKKQNKEIYHVPGWLKKRYFLKRIIQKNEKMLRNQKRISGKGKREYFWNLNSLKI